MFNIWKQVFCMYFLQKTLIVVLNNQNLVSASRLAEAFVSIQLEKSGLRDEMLDSFLKKKQAMGGIIKTLVSYTLWWILRWLIRFAASEVKFISLVPQDEAANIKRGLILDFLRKYVSENEFLWFLYKNMGLMMKMINSVCCPFHRFSTQMSQYCVRAQIIAYYFSLGSILDDIPSIRQSHFIIGQAGSPRVSLDAEVDLCPAR